MFRLFRANSTRHINSVLFSRNLSSINNEFKIGDRKKLPDQEEFKVKMQELEKRLAELEQRTKDDKENGFLFITAGFLILLLYHRAKHTIIEFRTE